MVSGANKPLGRRSLLFRMLGSASVAAAGAVPAMEPRRAQAYDPGEAETRARYRADSPEVQIFYRTNGYETLKK